ncbi:MAG: hypothetical protein LKF69_05115 [Bacilli bacterium]|jgi:hypothetical protein|nr:hypothetical protein [Bacilli bacterium]MCH4236157.1 hypothetical protein [Bacilli bacterium]
MHLVFSSLAGFDLNQISLVWNIIFFGLLGIIFLGFIFGLFRRLWKSTFALIFMATLLVIGFFMVKPISDYLIDFQLSQVPFVEIPSSISFELNGTIYPISLATGRIFVNDLLTSAYQSYGISPEANPQLMNYIAALTVVIIRYIVFFVTMLLIAIFGPIISLIIRAIISAFIPKAAKKKKKKFRLISATENMIRVALVSAMLVIPFTSIINTINQAFHDPDNAEVVGINDPNYASIMSFLDAYDNSLLANGLFNWNVNGDGKSIDTVLMDMATGEKTGNVEVTLSNELGSVAGIGKTLISAGFLTSDGSGALPYSVLMSDAVITSLFRNLSNSGLVVSVLPLAVSLALNTEEIKSVLGEEVISQIEDEFQDVNYKDELTTIGGIASDLAASGVATTLIDELTSDEEVSQEVMIDRISLLLDSDAVPSVKSALTKIDDSKLLSTILPAILYSTIQSSPDSLGAFAGVIPTTWEGMKAYKWGNELAIVYNSLARFYQLDNNFLHYIASDTSETSPLADVPQIQNKKVPGNVLYALSDSNLLTFVRDNYSEIIGILAGNFDSNGLPTDIDDEGKNTDLNGACLLDSDLIADGVDVIAGLLVSSIATGDNSGMADDIQTAIDGLNSTVLSTQRLNYKKEFNALITIMGGLLQDENTVAVLNQEAEATTIIDDDNSRNNLISLCGDIDNSKLISSILPGIMEDAVSNLSMLTDFGLSVNDFDFHVNNFGTELANMLEAYPDIQEISSTISSSTDILASFGEESFSQSLKNMLTAFYDSKILNPTNETEPDATFKKIIEYVFDQASDATSGAIDVVEVMNAADDVNYWTDAQAVSALGNTATGEISHLVNVLSTISSSGILGAMEEADPLNAITSTMITTTFDSIDQSALFSVSFDNILNYFLGPSIYDSSTPQVTFSNVNDWSQEGANLAIVVTNVQNAAISLSNFDPTKIDGAYLGPMLNALADSQIFVQKDSLTNEDVYYYGDFLLNKLKASTGLNSYIVDFGESVSDSSPFDTITSDFGLINVDGDIASSISHWKNENARVVAIIDSLNNITVPAGTNALDYLANGSATNSELEAVIDAVNDSSILRMIIPNAFDGIFSSASFEIAGLSLSAANVTPLIGGDNTSHLFNDYASLRAFLTERGQEINKIIDMKEDIDSLSTLSDFTSINDITEGTRDTLSSILHNMNTSQVFNLGGINPNDLTSDKTVFQQLIYKIMNDSSLSSIAYNTNNPKMAAKGYASASDKLNSDIATFFPYTNADLAAQGVEIDNFIDVFTALLNADSLSSVSGLDATSIAEAINATDLQSILDALNNSNLTYDVVPSLIDTVATSSSLSMSGIDFTAANPYFAYQYANGEFNSLATPNYDAKYPLSEIASIASIFDKVTGTDGLQSITANINDLSTIDDNKILTIESTLTELNSSFIFNRSGYASSYATSLPVSETPLSVFQQVMKKLLVDSQLSSVIYSSESPKDLSGGYLNAGAKTIDQIENIFPTNATSLSSQEAEIGNFMDIFRVFKTSSSLNSVAAFDASSIASSITSDDLESILMAFNNSELAYDAVPNLISSVVNGSSFAINGLDISAANPYFVYKYDGSNYLPTMSENYSIRYPENEIYGLGEIFDQITGTGSTDGLQDIATRMNDISTMTSSDIKLIEDTYLNLYHSFIFGQSEASQSYVSALPPGDNSLTVFEQALVKILTDSGLANMAYDNTHDTAYISAADKLETRLINFSSTVINEQLMNTTIEQEINDVMNIIRVVSFRLPSLSTVTDSITDVSSADLTLALTAINNSNLVYDATAKIIQDQLDNFGFTTLTEGYEGKYLGQKAYDDASSDIVITTDINDDTTSINLESNTDVDTDGKDIYYLGNLMDSFATTGGYLSLDSAGFDIKTDFLDQGKSLTQLIDFLKNSRMMATSADNGIFSTKTRSLVLYNLLDGKVASSQGGAAQYINGANKAARLNNVEGIFTHDYYTGGGNDDFSPVIEGKALDLALTDFSSVAGLTGASQLASVGSTVKALVESTYGYDENGIHTGTYRAYFASEVISGYITSALSGEYAAAQNEENANGSTSVVVPNEVIDWRGNDYFYLNDREATGFEVSLRLIVDFTTDAGSPEWEERIQEDFRLLGSLNDSFPPNGTGATWIDANSHVGQLLYMSSFMPSLTGPMAIVKNGLILNGLGDSYADNFVFENVGTYLTA